MAHERQDETGERRFRAVDVLTGTIDRAEAPRRARKQISAYLYPEQVRALGELHARLNSTADVASRRAKSSASPSISSPGWSRRQNTRGSRPLRSMRCARMAKREHAPMSSQVRKYPGTHYSKSRLREGAGEMYQRIHGIRGPTSPDKANDRAGNAAVRRIDRGGSETNQPSRVSRYVSLAPAASVGGGETDVKVGTCGQTRWPFRAASSMLRLLPTRKKVGHQQ